MAQVLDGEISFVQGDNIDINRSICLLPAAISKAWFTVKTSKASTNDVTAVFQKTITTANVPGQGVILDDGAGDGTAIVRFELTNANTVLLINEKAYYYDVQVLTIGGAIYTPELGIIKLRAERTKAIN